MQLTHLGPYRVDRQIGKGGMGSVYEATDPHSGQHVAIKALNPHLAEAEGFRERFEAEIESLKTLSHDGIVRLYGYGEQNGVLFYSMELVRGSSLEDELKAGRRFDWREVTDIAIQLCAALKHAHDHGIIHRDIKPANVLFADERRVKLADFGIARLFGTASSLTSAGGVLGTADYMSPEQADGRPVTARCDQYSLGGVMYSLLAGRPPFRAKTLPEMLQLQRFAQPEPVSRYAPDTPKQLEGVIAQLLAKEPADRFPNTAVLARHLQAMVMALSKPAHDSFSLAGEGGDLPPLSPGMESSLALAVTQVETELPRSATPPPKSLIDKPDDSPGANGKPAINDAETMPADEESDRKPRSSAANAPATTVAPAAVAAPRPSVFTTVEEDLARRQREHARSWGSILAPLLTLALALAALAGLGLYLARPSTADDLYQKISSHIAADTVEAIREVEREITEFVARFPDDERTTTLREHQQRLELDKLHRQLLRHRGGITDPALLPVEVLYLKAMSTAESSPDLSIRMLESLIRLYGTSEKPADPDDRRLLCVQLAQRQLVRLREDASRLATRQLSAVRERLAIADRLAKKNPDEARPIYQAIVDLYGNEPWATAVVAEAKQRLSDFQNKPSTEIPRQGDKETGRQGE
jgi:serine/threonine-protein kinase